MRDKDGQIIESRNGTYESKVKMFTFRNDVNMFTDSIFVKTNDLVYESEKDLATFGSATDVWKDDNMLSSGNGWYNKGRELFFFSDNVHVMTDSQEGWCDSLFFRRTTSDVEMLGNAQVTDTTRNVFALAGRIEYMDSLSKTTLTRKPAVISQTEEEDGSVDTVYLGAERLVYFTVPMYQVDSMAVEASLKRLADLNVDPVGEYRKKAAEEAAKAADEAAMNDPNLAAKKAAADRKAAMEKSKKAAQKKMKPQMLKDSLAVADSLAPLDSLAQIDSLAVADSLGVMDSLAVLPPKGTTRIGFLEAVRNVRIYKKNMQVVCDSLLYSDLDSLARFFRDPVIWQERTRQYAADSISLVVKGGAMDKASLMSNAFVTLQQDSTHFNQIKGTEMLAFFGDKGTLERFDVLGGASALFFIEENGVLATVNKTDSKMLSATFSNGEISRIHYYDQPKNDGYPKVQLTKEDRSLKGFNWQPEKRPVDRNAVTPLSLRPSQRLSYGARPRARFRQTDIYFPGYISDINRQIAVRDSLRKVREIERRLAAEGELEKAGLDSLALKDSLAKADSLAMADSLRSRIDSLAVTDSLKILGDSLAVADSLAAQNKVLTPEQQKAALKAEKREKAKKAREAARKKRKEAKEKRWAELDKRDEEKARLKEEKAKLKEREQKRKALESAALQAEKDAKILEKYVEKYRLKKEKEDSKTRK